MILLSSENRTHPMGGGDRRKCCSASGGTAIALWGSPSAPSDPLLLPYFVFGTWFAGIISITTAWGWATLDRNQRLRVSLGVPPSVEGTVAKRTWLLMHLAAGVVLFASSLALTSEDDESLPRIGAALLAFFLLQESWGIRRASRR